MNKNGNLNLDLVPDPQNAFFGIYFSENQKKIKLEDFLINKNYNSISESLEKNMYFTNNL